MNGYTSRVSQRQQQQQLGIYGFSSEAPETRLTPTVQNKIYKKSNSNNKRKVRTYKTFTLDDSFSVKKKEKKKNAQLPQIMPSSNNEQDDSEFEFKRLLLFWGREGWVR